MRINRGATRESTGNPSRRETVLSHAKKCIADSHQLCDKGQNLIRKSQDLRRSCKICPVCEDRTITPIQEHVLIGRKARGGRLPGSVLGYRCSNGHVFFAHSERPGARGTKK